MFDVVLIIVMLCIRFSVITEAQPKQMTSASVLMQFGFYNLDGFNTFWIM